MIRTDYHNRLKTSYTQ